MTTSPRSTPEEEATLRAIVRGLVQGVGYRFFVLRVAGELGLRGTVRNRADGTVEVQARGEEGRLKRLLAALGEGPPSAQVAEVRVQWGVAIEPTENFDVTH